MIWPAFIHALALLVITNIYIKIIKRTEKNPDSFRFHYGSSEWSLRVITQ